MIKVLDETSGSIIQFNPEQNMNEPFNTVVIKKITWNYKC